ncbi:hypothetical protein J6590_015572 [Homalodisca vitripennis]|nr:hypothetical protein J6590_015572 [Homalodisca vitripennis]
MFNPCTPMNQWILQAASNSLQFSAAPILEQWLPGKYELKRQEEVFACEPALIVFTGLYGVDTLQIAWACQSIGAIAFDHVLPRSYSTSNVNGLNKHYLSHAKVGGWGYVLPRSHSTANVNGLNKHYLSHAKVGGWGYVLPRSHSTANVNGRNKHYLSHAKVGGWGYVLPRSHSTANVNGRNKHYLSHAKVGGWGYVLPRSHSTANVNGRNKHYLSHAKVGGWGYVLPRSYDTANIIGDYEIADFCLLKLENIVQRDCRFKLCFKHGGSSEQYGIRRRACVHPLPPPSATTNMAALHVFARRLEPRKCNISS